MAQGCAILPPIVVTASLFVLATMLSGCGAHAIVDGGNSSAALWSSTAVSGRLHGGPNPVAGATITLYTTKGTGYGDAANVVATTATASDGSFSLTLPATTIACPSGAYAYLTAYAGNTGGNSNNTSSLMMAPIGSCNGNYTSVDNGGGSYTNTYTGGFIWIDELTTAVSAYALSGFMTVTGSTVNIDAPANNTSTSSVATPSAAGLAHAFANAANLFNSATGQPYTYFANRSSGGVIPDAEIFLLGNILQACVNSNGVTGTNTATSNDGTGCGRLFSMTTPPSATGIATPKNTLEAMLDLARYPNPSVNTWSSNCTAAGSGTTTATACLFNIATAISAYPNGLTSAPPDWALAIVYGAGYGFSNSGANCSSTHCQGLSYPYYVATDYQDNIYVLNYVSSSSPTEINILGFGPDGTSLFSTPESTTNLLVQQISTDTAGHVLGTNAATTASGASVLNVYSTATGALLTSVPTGGNTAVNTAVDPNNNVYFVSNASGGNLSRLTYGGTSASPTYSVATYTPVVTPGGSLQLSLDANLNIFVEESGSGTFKVDYALNTGTVSAPVYSQAFATTSITGATVATGAFGISTTASDVAYAASSKGISRITPTVTSGTATLASTSPTLLPAANGSATTDYFHYAYTDGAGNIIAPDNANGGSTPAGISVYDVVHGGLALGTYKGCFVASGVCNTTSGTLPMKAPRSAAIDSSGDVWVVSGFGGTLTELIGAAAPTWPGLSMLNFGKPE